MSRLACRHRHLGGLAWSVEARATTMIDGGPVGGQVWTAAGSPYLVRGVNGNLAVAAGEELRIEAGATVLFSDGYGRVLLTIDGKLTINGTAAAPATLQGETDASVWMGISIANEGAVIRITGAMIRNATTGINITRLADVQIGRTTFDSLHHGAQLEQGTVHVRFHHRAQEPPRRLVGKRRIGDARECAFSGQPERRLDGDEWLATAINCTFDRNYDGVLAIPGGAATAPSVQIQNAILSNKTPRRPRRAYVSWSTASPSTTTTTSSTAPTSDELQVPDPLGVAAHHQLALVVGDAGELLARRSCASSAS